MSQRPDQKRPGEIGTRPPNYKGGVRNVRGDLPAARVNELMDEWARRTNEQRGQTWAT